jgi:NADH dehydrogenase [ubiquinone] 1 alpha subcomplex assembly factor 7
MKSLNKFFLKSKKIPIDRFFENVLYDKKFGYYSKKYPFGVKGDYITAPLVSRLFSEMIAIWLINVWHEIGKPNKFNIVELGPGSGDLIKVLIESFKNFDEFYKSTSIFLYEKSQMLKKIQRKKIKDKKIKWISNFKKIKKGPTIFIGNEFFDAIPIKQFENKNGTIYEKYVELGKNNSLKISLKKTNNKKTFKKFKTLEKLSFIEFPEAGFKELDVITKKIKKLGGGLLLIDYGYTNPQNKDTLQSVMKQKKNNIFNNLGVADVTSLVNFELLEEYFKKNKLIVNKIVSQKNFLKNIGILERAEIISKKMSFKDKSNIFFRINRLIHPDGMGDLFKVIFSYKLKKKISLGFD